MKREPVSVGRILHYASLGSAPQDGVQQYPSTCRAAIVTEVVNAASGTVRLTVFNPEGFQQTGPVPFDVDGLALNGTPTPGTWHWPEKATAPLVGGAEPKEL